MSSSFFLTSIFQQLSSQYIKNTAMLWLIYIYRNRNKNTSFKNKSLTLSLSRRNTPKGRF
uniref:Uncharacterized protein n=1 Tax=Anguilla anguilla TaxID=7936 RepID=A0A0E9R897_ANGAN